MRIIVFFDLPVDTPVQRKSYRLFRKYLIKEGYLMLQESVYAKLVPTEALADSAIEKLKKNRPPQGLVQALRVTERQFATMVYITGEQHESGFLSTMEELVIV